MCLPFPSPWLPTSCPYRKTITVMYQEFLSDSPGKACLVVFIYSLLEFLSRFLFKPLEASHNKKLIQYTHIVIKQTNKF